ncbi:MAG: ATP-binding protein [Tildeniella torsiva UHER 1998/13D]|jgi:hypothetical protein|nr:ATP-binding protein [Tildeniella torsiva UHER 1998/13D]
MNNLQQNSSILVGKGNWQEATYIDPFLSNYKGNPLIEALPPIWTEDEVEESLRVYPEYDEEHRKMASHLRLHLIRNALQIFIPLPVHFDLEQRFSSMIRLGYQARNPSLKGFYKDVRTKATALNTQRRVPRSTASGFTIIGISGIGKTTSVEAILNLYPQVIVHRLYNDADFNFFQIVWLKLDCPHDGSIRGLCLIFFQAVDDILDTSYYKNYSKGRKTVDELLPLMAFVASHHAIGVLVIDEIQHLSQARSGGSGQMLNFFVQLINTIGLPVVLIGTFKARPILTGEFRQTRRGSGQGDLVWNRMSNDKNWQYFIDSLWSYQYTQKPCKSSESLRNTLYDLTQGITDFAVKLYMLAQIRAVSSYEEEINESTIIEASKEGLRMSRPIIEALKTNNVRILAGVEDVSPIDIDRHFEYTQGETNKPGQTEASSKAKSNPNLEADSPEKLISENQGEQTTEASQKRPEKNRKTDPRKAGLPEIAKVGKNEKLNAYDKLKEAGFIRDALEYIEG